MGRPAGIQQRSPDGIRYGVVLALSPTSDPSFRTQLRVALGSSTGTFVQLPDVAGMQGPGQYPTFVDVLPNDGQYRVYQSRAARDGYGSTQAWGHTVKVKPALIPEGVTQSMPVTGHRVGSNVSLSTGAKLQYGSAAVQSSGQRTTFYPASLWVPITTGVSYSRSISGPQSNSLSVPSGLGASGSSAYQFVGSLVLPSHATIQKLSVVYLRLSSGVKLGWKFQALKAGTTAGAITIWSTANPPVSTGGVLTASKSVTVSSTSYDFVLAALAIRSSGGSAPPNFYGVTATYTVPSYDKTV